jgi:hypothetical protein
MDVQLSLQWLKNNYNSFNMNINNLSPTYLCIYLFTYPPTHLSTYIHTYPPNHLLTTYLSPTYLPIYLPNNPSINLPTYLLTKPPIYHLPITYVPTHPPTHLFTHHLNANPLTHLFHQPTYLSTYFLFIIFFNLPTSYLSSYNLLPTS